MAELNELEFDMSDRKQATSLANMIRTLNGVGVPYEITQPENDPNQATLSITNGF